MGALRAVELAPYGMRGVGIVYRMFASGEVDGDDEVGVLHGPAELGYRVLTAALVSLRYGCRQGAGTGQIPAAVGQRIVAAAKAMPFTDRTWPDLEHALPPDAGAGTRLPLRAAPERSGALVPDVTAHSQDWTMPEAPHQGFDAAPPARDGLAGIAAIMARAARDAAVSADSGQPGVFRHSRGPGPVCAPSARR
jgi:hypothetical protein